MIQAVITAVQAQRDSVERLVRYCEKLDGTKVKIVPLTPEEDARFRVEHPENEKACRAAFSLRHAARAMKGKPFLWLEHDAVPLKQGWADRLAKEYASLGKPFLLSSDSNPPHDLVGGIGIYPGTTEWMVPANLQVTGWDLFLLQQLGPLVARTPLIQHSYGVYREGKAQPHRFPRDAGLLRPDALIFHRDAQQELMGEANRAAAERVFYHSGDLGDVIYHLEVIRRMGGGKLMLGPELGVPNFRSHCREPMTPKRCGNIAPLLQAQKYITEVEHWNGAPKPEWTNLNLFRQTFKGSNQRTCTSLQRAGLRHFGLVAQDETQPWLDVGVCYPELEGKIIVARSPRYHDPKFPWRELVAEFREWMVFVGLDEEYDAFCQSFGRVERHRTNNLLEVAVAIASGCLFMGNQSGPYAIAEGLKQPAVLETWPEEPNCLFQRGHLLHLTSDLDSIRRFVSHYI